MNHREGKVIESDKERNEAPDSTRVGRCVGRYQLIQTLGSGGMSVVYKAIAADASEAVALKVLHTPTSSDSNARRRFRREAETIRSLDHPHVVPLRDFGTHDETSFLAMKLIEGETVSQQIRSSAAHSGFGRTWETPEPETVSADFDSCVNWTMTEKALAIADIADALHHAHRRGIVHRDVKPSNLLIDLNRKVWLTDFGLASATDDQTVVTKTGQLIGTPHYMSPEQASRDAGRVDHQADIYSLGATLYEWVTLQRPFEGEQLHVLSEIARGRLKPPSQVCTNIPTSLETIVLTAMSHSPSGRYQSAAEMAGDLRRFACGDFIRARRPGPADRAARWLVQNPKRAIWSLVGVAAVVLAVVLTQFMAGQRLTDMNLRLAANKRILERTNLQIATTNRDLFRSQSRLRRQVYVADMASAYRAFAQGDLHAVHRLLAQQVPGSSNASAGTPNIDEVDERGFEWWLLQNLSGSSDALTLPGHDGSATEAFVHPSRNEAFSVGEDGWVRRCDLASGRSVHQWLIGKRLDALAISPDGTRLVTGRNAIEGANAATIYDAETGAIVTPLRIHENSMESAAYSPDGNWIATAERYQDVFLSNAAGEFQGRIPTLSRNESLHFSPDSRQLLAIVREPNDDERQTLRSWTVPELMPAKTWSFDFKPLLFAFSGNRAATNNVDSPDVEQRMVVAGVDAWAITRWIDGKTLKKQNKIRGRVRCVAINTDGSYVATGCDNGLIYVWQIDASSNANLRSPRVMTAGNQKITSLTFTNGDRLLASTEDGALQVWSLPPQASRRATSPKPVLAIASQNALSERLYLRSAKGDIERLDLRTLETELVANVATDNFCRLATSPDESVVVATCLQSLVVVSTNDGRMMHRIEPHLDEKACRGLAFTRDGRQLVVLFNDRFRCYETTDWKQTNEIWLPNLNALQVVASPNDDEILILSEDLLLWYDSMTWQSTTKHSRRFGAFNVARYTSDGTTVAVGHQDGSIELLSASNAELLDWLQGHQTTVEDLRFIQNDRILVSSDLGSKIRFWDVASGRELGAFDTGNQNGKLRAVPIHFSQPLQRLLTFDYGQPFQVWDSFENRAGLGER